jgi:hypothetical protein
MIPPVLSKDNNSLSCKYCAKRYSHKSSLSRHISTAHGTEKGTIPCELCEHRFINIQKLVNHLQEYHSISMTRQAIEFNSFAEFISWKEEEETNTHSWYVQHYAPQDFNERNIGTFTAIDLESTTNGGKVSEV